MLKFSTGNLFDAEVDALVNTVNTAGVMGKGLALQFKKGFPQNFRAYASACKRGEVQIGKMFVFDAGGIVQPRYIINFPTKTHWRAKSKLEYVASGLDDLVCVIRDRKIKSIAVPPLGAGLGGLDWRRVRDVISAKLSNLEGVDVLVFEPKGAPPAESMPNRTVKPRMTPGRAAVIALMNRYFVPGYDYPLTVLEVQKLAYFLQEAGQPLKLNYTEEAFGPYADALRHVLNHLEGHYISGFADGKNQPTTELHLKAGAADEAEEFLKRDPEAQERLRRVAALIEGFETPFGMELLATVHWVAKRDRKTAASISSTVKAVHEWNARKASTMKPQQIETAWSELKEGGWLAVS
ncbi:MAG: macro domain-containing protein [Polyangiaceae bacterium]